MAESADEPVTTLSLAQRLDPTLEQVLDAMPDGVAIVDERRVIVHVNVQLVHMLGFARVEFIGTDIDRFIANISGTDLLDVDASLRLPADDALDDCWPVMLVPADGSGIPVIASSTRIEVGGRPATICVFRDCSREQRLRAEYSITQKRFEESQRIARIGSWEKDLTRDAHWWSASLYTMLQVPPETGGNLFEQFVQRVHPADRETLMERARRGATGAPLESLEVRVLLPDGSSRIMLSRAKRSEDAMHRPVRLYGTLQDITERKRLEQKSRAVEQRYRDAQRIARIGNWEWDEKTQTSWWSDELYAILEEDPSTCEPRFENFLHRIHPDDRHMVIRSRDENKRNPRPTSTIRARIATSGSTHKTVDITVRVELDSDGAISRVQGTVHDVTERHELEKQLRESEARYASTVELAALGIAHVSSEGEFLWANRHLLDMLGYSLAELQAMTIHSVSHPDDRSITDADRQKLHRGEIGSMTAEKRYLRSNGEECWVRITGTVKRDEHGVPLYDIAIVEDISDRKVAEQRVQYLATHDEMTGLRNRAMFAEILTHSLAAAKRHNRCWSVLFIDLDRFKIINDSLGHEAGDQLITEVATRLRNCVRKSDVIARLGGDEFVILIEEPPEIGAAEEVAKKILSTLLPPVRIHDQECRITASIGIARFPDDAADAATLMKHADMAMYLAKEEGKNNYQFYSPERSPVSVERLALETHLANALQRNEFRIMYQPKVDVATGRINGTEALLRWWNPELGTVSPAQFIPVAEDTGLVVQIGKWVLRQACEQNVAWQRQGLPRIAVAVNLSPRQFGDASLLDDIAEVLRDTGMDAELLELEITESMIMHNVDRAAKLLAAIKDLGIRLAIDDFGTGYSSLSQLKRFPIDTLKIDRSFVRDIPGNSEDKAIAEAIISLGKTLGVSVIAEGVETAEQFSFLEERACDSMQGYYFSRPCSPDALAGILRENFITR